MSLDEHQLCDRCADRRVAAITGFPELPEPPPQVAVQGPDGRRHELAFRLWRAPTGIEVELEETGVPIGDGYHFVVLGAHDADVSHLVAQLTDRAKAEIGRLYPEPRPRRAGWLIADDAWPGGSCGARRPSGVGPTTWSWTVAR